MLDSFASLFRRKSMLSIKVVRYKSSLEYLRNPKKPFDWGNNDWNNCEDDYFIYWGETEVFRCKVQSVANMEGLDVPERGSPRIKFTDTIAPGKFQLKAFVDTRNFYGRIHGICDCRTLAGDYIGMESVTTTNKARWLEHDDQKHKTDAQGKVVPPGTLTRMCWSAGCFVHHMKDLEAIGAIFDQYGVKQGQYIPGELILA